MTQQQWEGQVVPLTPHGATSTCPLRFQVLWKATFDSDTQVCSHRTLGFILLDHWSHGMATAGHLCVLHCTVMSSLRSGTVLAIFLAPKTGPDTQQAP